MARFNILDAEKYGGQGGGGYFSLKKHGDSARVRIMYKSYEDVEGYAVHEVEINGKKRNIDCLRKHTDSLDTCPFCKKGMFTKVKVFIPLYCVDSDRVEIWEKGKSYFSKLKNLFENYANDKPLVSTVFEIEKTLDETGYTSFDITPQYSGIVELDDLPEVQPVYGRLVLQKTAGEMEDYLRDGYFEDEYQKFVS